MPRLPVVSCTDAVKALSCALCSPDIQLETALMSTRHTNERAGWSVKRWGNHVIMSSPTTKRLMDEAWLNS